MSDEKSTNIVIDCTKKVVNPRTSESIKESADTKSTDLNFGTVIGRILSEEKSDQFKPMRAWILGHKFYTQAEVELDKDDFNNLKAAVEKSQLWVPFVLGQVLEYLTGL